MATTLQINLAPTDLPHLIQILPILLTLDLHRSHGRFGTGWRERLPGFLDFVQEQSAVHPKIRVHEVDYSRNAVTTISEQFFGGELIPPKDWNGGPFYSYFSGFANAHTRVAFFDRRRLISHLAPLPLLQPPIFRRWQARLEGNFPYILPEAILSFSVRRAGFLRIDFLGQEPGMWSIHPPYRNTAFYEQLPLLIQNIEQGELPDGQLGHHDINDSMVDWSSVRKSAWRRKLGHLQLIYSQMKGRQGGVYLSP